MINNNLIIINGKQFQKFIGRGIIEQNVEKLASDIINDYKNKNPLFLIVLKGSIFFAADLLRKINFDCEIDTISAKSYGLSMSSLGDVKLILPERDLNGRHIIIIEDIVDTGLTLYSITEKLKRMNTLSVESVAMFSKPSLRTVNVDLKYIGLEIPNNFIIGYGLDYAEKGRNLPDVYHLFE